MPPDRRGPTLVLGGSGFLGAHVLAQALAASDRRAHESGEPAELVISAGRTEPPMPFVSSLAAACCASEANPTTRRSDAATTARVEWHPFDALRARAARELVEQLRPARTIVCTALSTIPECESYPGLAHALNVELPREIARRCAEIGARFVLVSTDLVFGATPPPPHGFDESASPAPITTYGRTKAEGEDAVLAAHERGFGAPVHAVISREPALGVHEHALDARERGLIVRLPLLFGDSGGRGLGASDRVLHAVRRGERPAMFTDEWRTPLDVARAAEALVELAHGDRTGILHVAGPERVSRRELALRALVASGRSRDEAESLVASTTRAEAGLASSRPADTSLDARLARTFLRTPLEGPSEALTREAFERRAKAQR
jgi:dTDP-4-dehydrorhamnose reductase